jgi:hypothetical protein
MLMDRVYHFKDVNEKGNRYQLVLLMVGGQAQNLSNFQIAPIPILSVLNFSTSSPHDILKVLRKIIDHNLPIGQDKHDD